MSIGPINSSNQATSLKSSQKTSTAINKDDKTKDRNATKSADKNIKQGFLRTIWSKVKDLFRWWLGVKPAPKTRKIKTFVSRGKGKDGQELFELREVTVPGKLKTEKSLHGCGSACGSPPPSNSYGKTDHSHDSSHGHDGGHSCGSHSCGGHGCGA